MIINVINVGGYIGQSTRSEIDYARGQGKTAEFPKSPDGPGMRSRGIIVPGTISRQERCE